VEHKAAEGEAEPEGADRKGSDGNPLAPDRQPLPVAERRSFGVGQLLPSPFLTQGTPGLKPEVEVVEDLW